MNYSADDIVVNKWAELKQTPDGKWHRSWDIVLKKNIAEAFNLEDVLKGYFASIFSTREHISTWLKP